MAISPSRALELLEMYKPVRTKVEAVDKKYSLDYHEPTLDMPESLDLVKLTYEEKSEEELRALASEQVEATYIRRQQQLDASHARDMQNIDKAYLDIAESSRQTNAKLREDYTKEVDSVYKRLVNNGLIFSTVMSRANKDALTAYNKNVAEADTHSDNLRAKVDADKASKNAAYNEACNVLNNEKQSAIQKAYNSLVVSEYNKRVSVEKYNNQLDEKEKKYQMSRAKALESARQAENNRAFAAVKLYSQVGSYGYEQNIILEKYNIFQQFLSGLRREEANAIISSDSFARMHLKSYYSTLQEWIERTLPA